MNDALTDTQHHIAEVGRAMSDGRWKDVFDSVSADVVAHVPEVGSLLGIDALAGIPPRDLSEDRRR